MSCGYLVEGQSGFFPTVHPGFSGEMFQHWHGLRLPRRGAMRCTASVKYQGFTIFCNVVTASAGRSAQVGIGGRPGFRSTTPMGCSVAANQFSSHSIAVSIFPAFAMYKTRSARENGSKGTSLAASFRLSDGPWSDMHQAN